jgi:ABC-type transport system involved in cytochrome bd biosynthesis fused ATPase/permease subunit
VGTNVAAGSGVAVVGIILAAVTQGMVFDITGGVLTALGFLVAGVTLGLQRGNVMKRYRSEMEKGRNRLREELSAALYAYIETLKTKMDDQFKKFDGLIQTETTELQSLQLQLKKVDTSLLQVKKVISKLI